jgi:plasmid stability protein
VWIANAKGVESSSPVRARRGQTLAEDAPLGLEQQSQGWRRSFSSASRLLSVARKQERWKVGFVKTTLDLPEDLVREMKLRAVHEGRKLRDVAIEIFRRGLAQPSLQTAAATQPSVIQNRVKLPLIRCQPGTPKFNLTPEDIDQILLEQEMKRFNEACGH